MEGIAVLRFDQYDFFGFARCINTLDYSLINMLNWSQRDSECKFFFRETEVSYFVQWNVK